MHNKKFPNESQEYRQARNQLLKEEIALRKKIEEVAELRRKLPLGGKVKNYVFKEGGNSIQLEDLFGDKEALILYNYMYSEDMQVPCSMCTSIIDALEGTVEHLNQRVSTVVVAKNTPQNIELLKESRDYKNVRIISSKDNTFNIDYYGEDQQGNQWPMCHVFIKKPDGVYHFHSSELFFVAEENIDRRHVDLLWPLWNYLDLTPQGRGDWYPKLVY